MVTAILSVIAVLLLGAVIYLSLQSGTLTVRRSILIRAPIEDVYQRILNFKTWSDWSPWLIHEPTTPLTFSETPDVVDGWYAWDGKWIGAGRITHVALTAPVQIRQRIDFIRPFKSQSDVQWDFVERGTETEVTWSMHGTMPFLLRFLIPMMTRAIEKDYELGLALLRGAMDPSAERPQICFDGVVQLEPRTIAFEAFSGHLEELKSTMRLAYPRLAESLRQHGLAIDGPALAAYSKFNVETRTTDCRIGFPIGGDPSSNAVPTATLPGGDYLKVTLQGSYEFLEVTWAAAVSHLRMKKLKSTRKKPMLEIYERDPSHTSVSNELVTAIYLPLQ